MTLIKSKNSTRHVRMTWSWMTKDMKTLLLSVVSTEVLPSVWFLIRAKTNIPNIRIFLRNNQTNIRSFPSEYSFEFLIQFKWIFLTIFGSFWSFWGSGEIFSCKIDYCELNYDHKLIILRLLRVTGNIYWLSQSILTSERC